MFSQYPVGFISQFPFSRSLQCWWHFAPGKFPKGSGSMGRDVPTTEQLLGPAQPKALPAEEELRLLFLQLPSLIPRVIIVIKGRAGKRGARCFLTSADTLIWFFFGEITLKKKRAHLIRGVMTLSSPILPFPSTFRRLISRLLGTLVRYQAGCQA